MEPIKVLTANVDKPNSKTIDVYLEGGGYEAARKALASEVKSCASRVHPEVSSLG